MEFINPIFEFSRAMRRLGLDDAEYALLIAINIFSADRPNVQEPSRVEALQQPYVEALLSYTRIKRPQVPELPVYLSRLRVGSGAHWGPPSQILSVRSAETSQALSLSTGSPDKAGLAGLAPAGSPGLLSPAGPAALPADAHEAGEPAHPQLRALGAGLRAAAPGQEAAAPAVRDLGCARVGAAAGAPAMAVSS